VEYVSSVKQKLKKLKKMILITWGKIIFDALIVVGKLLPNKVRVVLPIGLKKDKLKFLGETQVVFGLQLGFFFMLLGNWIGFFLKRNASKNHLSNIFLKTH
jgi:hypothetical protein